MMWKSLLQQPITTAQQAKQWVEGAAESGQTAVRSLIGNLPLCASMASSDSKAAGDRLEDTTHYFLLPCGLSESGYVMFTKRQLPEGVGPANDLPTVAQFHLPNEGAEKQLEALVLSGLSGRDAHSDLDSGETLDQRLERVAEQIDKQSRYVTGGILLVGGAVACANPLLGVGIMAKAMFPSMGAKLSAEAVKLGGDRVRKWRQNKEDRQQKKHAAREHKKRELRLLINPFLARLQRALETDEEQLDPSMEDPFLALETDEFDERYRAITVEVLAEYYHQIAPSLQSDRPTRWGSEDVRWLKMLAELAKANG